VIKAQASEHFLIVVSCTVKEELVSFLESLRYAPALHVILTLKIELQSKGFGA